MFLVVLLVTTVAGAARPASLSTSSGDCPGTILPNATVNGSLARVGTSEPLPTAAYVSVSANYSYEEVVRTGSGTTKTCVTTSTITTTDGAGNFVVPLPIPTDQCSARDCRLFFGPFGPVTLGTPHGPGGYALSTSWAGPTTAHLIWWADLAKAILAPASLQVVSVGAPVPVVATALSSQGTPALGPLVFRWSVDGLGWGLAESGGPRATAQTQETWNGTLNVSVSADYTGTEEWANSSSLTLVPVPTRVLEVTATPTAADYGTPVRYDLLGSGAAGYPYRASFTPGLGLPAVPGACVPSPQGNGTVELLCNATGRYLGNGTAFPAGSLSNGYSSATAPGPAVAVHPDPVLDLRPTAPTAFPGENVTLAVRVLAGTGTAPFGPACVDAGPGGSVCVAGPGPDWRFSVRYTAAGTYPVHATVADATGTKASLEAVLVVVPVLSVAPIGSATILAQANAPTNLSVRVVGGALPLEYWWNLSRPATTVAAGALPFDGSLAEIWTPRTAGVTDLTVVVRDRLGQTAVVVFAVTVSVVPPSGNSGSAHPLVPAVLSWLPLFLLGALGAAAVVALRLGRRAVVRRPPSAPDETPEGVVTEAELERIAQGRAHLLAGADPADARPLDVLMGGWRGPWVAPSEWAEWVATLVAEGSLLPDRFRDGAVGYRRAPARSPTATVDLRPELWEEARLRLDAEADGSDAEV